MMRPALFESQDSAGRFVSNAEESKSHGRKWLTSAVCCGNIWIPRTSQAGLTGNAAKRRRMLQFVCPIAVFRKKVIDENRLFSDLVLTFREE